jgi:hypothetical protein
MQLLMEGIDRPVIQNAVRSMYVEYQVAVLLGDEWSLVGTDWGGWDFQSRSGIRLELKQSAAKQSWVQKGPSRGVFDIAERTGRYVGADWIAGRGRFADLYIFAWHDRWDETADQRDESQWTYFVIPTSQLPTQRTIGVAVVRKLAEPTTAPRLRETVLGASRLVPLTRLT